MTYKHIIHGIRRNGYLLASVMLATFLIMGCSKEITADFGSDAFDGDNAATSRLTVATRGSGNTDIQQGRIYVFSSSGSCVALMDVDDESKSATTNLEAGSYTVYAIGGADLNRFVLPEQDDAQPESVISLQQGKVLDDLLIKSASATMAAGEVRQLNITLERKVLSIEKITINKVPTDVTAVSVTLEPMRSGVCLNGAYSDTNQSYKADLTLKEGTTWENASQTYLFPSNGKPTITISFTRGENIRSYSYTASEDLPANHHFTIEGTYTEDQSVSLTGILTSEDWGEDRTITFEFDETNASGGDNSNNNDPGEAPVAKSIYKDCYVVSVDAINNTAVLLSPTETVEESVIGAGDNQSLLNTRANQVLASWEDVEGVSGTWRLPTYDEMKACLEDQSLIAPPAEGSSIYYFCKSNTQIGIIKEKTLYSGNVQIYDFSTDSAPSSTLFRPVIDVTY